MLGWYTGGPEPAAECFRTDLELLLLLQGFGEVVSVVLGELGLVQVQNAPAEALGFGVVRLAATVAVADAGIACGPDLGFEPDCKVRGDWSATSGYEATRRLLASSPPFSAIFAQNDRMAVGAIRALREVGRRVPDDFSVIGYDDIPLASYFDPPLTTLQQPMQETGKQAARLLVKTIQDPSRTPEQISLPARLIERASCAPVGA